MKPGRELDALVAEKVFEFEWRKCPTTDKLVPWCYDKEEKRYVISLVPEYSTDTDAAWEVVEKFKLRSERIHGRATFSVQFNEPYWACFIGPRSYDNPEDLLAESAPHAICLAALKAVGVEID